MWDISARRIMRSVKAVPFLILLLTFSASGGTGKKYAKPNNFNGVKFGKSMEKLIEVLEKDSIEYERIDSLNILFVPELAIKERVVAARFFFHKNKFTYFSLEGSRHTVDNYHKTLEEANFLAQYFRERYGEWKKVYIPELFKIDSTLYCTHGWRFSDQTVFVGLVKEGAETYAIAKVSDNKLMRASGSKEAEKYNSSTADKVYVGNKNSKVFHRPDCPSARRLKSKVYFDSREEAIEAGYRPCKRCNP